MKILFICGSLEEGKDGVGDYTRRLAGEVIRQGNACAIIALTDKYVNDIKEENQESEGTIVPVLRLSYKNGYKKNAELAKPWLVNFKPNWVSLQYVPFSFQDKGLPFSFGKVLQNLAKGYKLHIMFHELWAGMEKETNFKLRLLGEFQKKILKDILYKSNPNLIQTQVTLYKKHLEKLNFVVSILPLFGNIPVFKNHDVIKEENLLKNKQDITFIVFGTICKDSPIELFAKEVKAYSLKNKINVTFKFVGRCGKELEHWCNVLDSFDLERIILGELSAIKISEELQKASIGIVTTPGFVLGKSGIFAAMKEHGLEIMYFSKKWNPRGIEVKDLMVENRPFLLEKIEDYFDSFRITNVKSKSLSDITSSFLETLKGENEK